MLLFIRTQIVAILLGIGWVFLLNILAFLNHPDRLIEQITPIKYGLVILTGVFYFLFMKNYTGRRWPALPLIFIPYVFVYHPLFPIIQRYMKIGSKGHLMNVESFILNTSHLFLFVVLVAIVLSIMFSRKPIS
ncbi:hypothetical protein [Bacillus suaedaesalsae]|uniref:VanZ-like domain-containing protein n=1 Tax=Bacillus suaedaesalsae TaxID=2810349 RepID=A0ABS2DNI1_9BACI|nr:hypothetical protein [Bacillus suaedaesalsae]MBM6619635.1 hypothetical protein [Bacillus suaedaesalsae]